MKKILLSIALLFVIIIGTTACGTDQKKEIVGTWKNDTYLEGYEFVYTFNEDGTGKYDAAGSIDNFKYTVDGNKLTLEYTDEDMATLETTFSISGDTLKVKDANNEDVSYERVK